MSKLLELIRHYPTGHRASLRGYAMCDVSHSQVPISPEAAAIHPLLDEYVADMHVRVYYLDHTSADSEAKRGAENQLVATLYTPLLPHIYAMRQALHAGDVDTARRIMSSIINEVTP